MTKNKTTYDISALRVLWKPNTHHQVQVITKALSPLTIKPFSSRSSHQHTLAAGSITNASPNQPFSTFVWTFFSQEIRLFNNMKIASVSIPPNISHIVKRLNTREAIQEAYSKKAKSQTQFLYKYTKRQMSQQYIMNPPKVRTRKCCVKTSYKTVI